MLFRSLEVSPEGMSSSVVVTGSWMTAASSTSMFSSLDAFYGPDILYDYLSYDGWEMVYSTFKSSGPKLIDPYFVLYNKYRGTLRVYVYINSLTYTPSTYLQYSLMINGSDNTSILNFLGNEIIDQSKNPKSYNAVMQEPLNGGAPAMNNQWYMMEFELAYDPSLKDKSAQSLRFGLKTDCYNVSTIKLGGTAESEISGNIGATSNQAPCAPMLGV